MEMTLAFILLCMIVLVVGILGARAIECHAFRTKKNRRAGDVSTVFTGPDRRRDTKRGPKARK